jgi:hypothetical protein
VLLTTAHEGQRRCSSSVRRPARTTSRNLPSGRRDDLRDAAASIAAGEGLGVEDIVVRNDRAVGTVARSHRVKGRPSGPSRRPLDPATAH